MNYTIHDNICSIGRRSVIDHGVDWISRHRGLHYQSPVSHIAASVTELQTVHPATDCWYCWTAATAQARQGYRTTFAAYGSVAADSCVAVWCSAGEALSFPSALCSETAEAVENPVRVKKMKDK